MRVPAAWKLPAGLVIVAIAVVAGSARGATATGLGAPQMNSVQLKLSGPADRLDVAFGTPDLALKVRQVLAFNTGFLVKGEPCFAEGFLSDRIEGANADPALANHEVWTLLFPGKCLRDGDEVLIIAVPVADNHLVIKGATAYNTSGTPLDPTDDTLVGTGNAAKLDWGKFPRLENLWLCTQPSAFSQCNAAILFQILGQPIKSPDPKCPSISSDPAACPRQELGAFEFELRFDPKFLDVELIPLPFLDGSGDRGGCLQNRGEGFVQLACVSKGKEHPVAAPTALSVAVIRPKPDVYSILVPNQQNGIATQLINQGCQLADLQGHPIPLEGLDVCQDGAITIRYLEGDVHADCVVDARDQQQVAFRYGSRLGNLLYNQRFDLEPSAPKKGDGDIDAKDLQFVFGRHGSTCHEPHPPQVPVDPKAKP